MDELKNGNDGELTKNVREYCEYYNLPLTHLVEIISDLKVVPMLRGKGFEFTVSDLLREHLTLDKWDISNPIINAQSEVHDIDVLVSRKRDARQIVIECKLSKNDSFSIKKIEKKHIPTFNVKCMRSRTISDNRVAETVALKYRVSKEDVLNHADNYRDVDFDFVVTSMGNAFWATEDNAYVFKGKSSHMKYFEEAFPDHFGSMKNSTDFKQKTFDFILIARSSDLTVSHDNGIICKRRKCKSSNCGFIPNYPVISLPDVITGKSPWKIVNDTDLSELFNKYLDEIS